MSDKVRREMPPWIWLIFKTTVNLYSLQKAAQKVASEHPSDNFKYSRINPRMQSLKPTSFSNSSEANHEHTATLGLSEHI